MQNILTEKGKTIILNTVGNPVLTNCYIPCHEIMDKIAAHEIICFCYERMVVLIHPENGIHKLYYFLSDMDILISGVERNIQEDLGKYRNLVGTVVARLPDKNVEVLQKLGFTPYKEYIRKQMVSQKKDWCGTAQIVETAAADDIQDIYQLLYGTFDIISDHLVSKEELGTLLGSCQVLKVCIDGALAGVLLFETFGKKSYLRSICVSEEFIGKKIGLTLLEEYIRRNQERTKLFYLWVESTNEKAIRLYERFSYKDDGLREYIYLYKDDLTTK